jgi:hypothetical protein
VGGGKGGREACQRTATPGHPQHGHPCCSCRPHCLSRLRPQHVAGTRVPGAGRAAVQRCSGAALGHWQQPARGAGRCAGACQRGCRGLMGCKGGGSWPWPAPAQLACARMSSLYDSGWARNLASATNLP